jgi:hypothetical protein
MTTDPKTALRQARAALTAEFQFKQRLERIEWEESVMKPELERLALEINNGVLPVFEISNED